ncbi:MAG TPA: PKD domain-containing protein [Bacteroidales bacterium]|nr:PKD domain-containing protein [Bacteroidales bacterium]HNR42113.1 PKD domain-containing protein [Bacteroidales bacterium]HQG78365.1 PKD domain-containing protein [Bacteroidales bacterium]
MRIFIITLTIFLASFNTFGQNCSIKSKANDITPDKLCSPVTASWDVRYNGVNNAGRPVSIRYDWDNGVVVDVPATEIGPGVFEANAVNTYTSMGRRCNYHPRATLIVNGQVCTSSTQEQIVTVWDDDDHNGGDMHINPVVWPICVGNSDNARFRDLTQFNCVPPQERDNPNIHTRWIQWVYGTANTMTGVPVTVDGVVRPPSWHDAVITLTGPVTGSGVWSRVISVANDKPVGQYYEVTLRNWNYCNPYDDPNIPGPPADPVNGDHPPVETTARILIVPYPDATINPVAPMCANAPAVTLTAHDPGGRWSGPGIVGNRFYPSVAGPGVHTITYNITSDSGCSNSDTETITVLPIPDATINPVGILCNTDPPFRLTAATPGGTWSGPAPPVLIGDIFDPSIAGPGNYTVRYDISKDGCSNTSSVVITVATPDATIDPVDTLCVNSPPVTMTAHDLGGIWIGNGMSGNIFYPAIAGPGDHVIIYDLNNPDCTDADTITVTVMPIPDVTIRRVGTVYIHTPPVLLAALPTGGTFSGTGVNGLYFDAKTAGIGTHVITYTTLTDKFGCKNQDTIHIHVTMPPFPTARFEPDTSGCNPFTVQFRNRSIGGESYLWDFDDKTFSMEENPVHTWYVPGTYNVKLTVTNLLGSATHEKQVTVFRSPVASFGAYPTHVINNQQVVVFYNYSYYDSTYLWDFGDNTTSTEKNPWHKYEDPGTYNVTLWVTSKDGCVDSTIMNTPVIVEFRTGFIGFPNVFKWNGTGPTGGAWREGVYPEMDNVFRPFFENVIEYKLQIFNRWGVLIYESNDLYKGWDGYFGDGNLAIQGVYVWRASGQFADGVYFNRVGDVTFLH